MPVYGDCPDCGTETIDYGCPACDSNELEQLKQHIEQLQQFIEHLGYDRIEFNEDDNPPPTGEKED